MQEGCEVHCCFAMMAKAQWQYEVLEGVRGPYFGTQKINIYIFHFSGCPIDIHEKDVRETFFWRNTETWLTCITTRPLSTYTTNNSIAYDENQSIHHDMTHNSKSEDEVVRTEHNV